MKRIIFLYIIAGTLVFASCADDTPPTAKYVTVNLQIGGDSTLNLSGGSTSFDYSNSTKDFIKPISATRAVVNGVNVPDFVPEVPKQFTAYLIANENKNGYSINQFVDSVTVHTGSNHITVPAMKYKVYVSNYKYPGMETNTWNWENWYSGHFSSPMEWPFPGSTTILYLYGKNEKMDFTNGAVGEIKMTNPYAAVCVYKNEYVRTPPIAYTKGEYFSQKGNWFYTYINCASSSRTNIGIMITPNIWYTYFNDKISANQIYQYVFSGD
ncbi:MAG: hypothetical protein LKK21_06680 [Prevotella sp.]|jgi:hypothetical protein|nr:hypothetical protein [Prevotella sp.]MCH3984811.1 hypothetical protein [Prevotella sp.]MCI2087865.1 hypothetical protein [Prevotella sp.]MCI2125314.1 hypothetical protein [Prevotella sp.]